MTAEQVVDKYPMEKDFWSFILSREAAIEAAKEYSKLQNKELAERVKELESLMQEFVDRVDRGEVRSKKTYAKFKEALK